MPQPSQPDPDEIEQETRRREAEELANFERRAQWWGQHYGGVDADEAARRLRKAVEQADRMASDNADE